MAKHDDIPKTDPSEIEALIKQLKQSIGGRSDGHFRRAIWLRTGEGLNAVHQATDSTSINHPGSVFGTRS